MKEQNQCDESTSPLTNSHTSTLHVSPASELQTVSSVSSPALTSPSRSCYAAAAVVHCRPAPGPQAVVRSWCPGSSCSAGAGKRRVPGSVAGPGSVGGRESAGVGGGAVRQRVKRQRC